MAMQGPLGPPVPPFPSGEMGLLPHSDSLVKKKKTETRKQTTKEEFVKNNFILLAIFLCNFVLKLLESVFVRLFYLFSLIRLCPSQFYARYVPGIILLFYLCSICDANCIVNICRVDTFETDRDGWLCDSSGLSTFKMGDFDDVRGQKPRRMKRSEEEYPINYAVGSSPYRVRSGAPPSRSGNSRYGPFGKKYELPESRGVEDTVGVKEITCGGAFNGPKMWGVDQICPAEIAELNNLVRKIDLSNNSISTLYRRSFVHFSCLRKLELRANGLHTIEDGAFESLGELRKLDLSLNRLVSIKATQLRGLTNIRRIKLSDNPLQTIDSNIYLSTPHLIYLDLLSTSLRCDCRLLWLVQALRRGLPGVSKLRLPKATQCQTPQTLRNSLIRTLRPNQLTCDVTPSTTPPTVLELSPLVDQVVFAGDSLTLRCFISWGTRSDRSDSDDLRIEWLRDNEPLQSSSDEAQPPSASIFVNTRQRHDGIESFVEIKQLMLHHGGKYACRVENEWKQKEEEEPAVEDVSDGAKSLSIYVIHRDTKFCAVNETVTSRGVFTWPHTVAGVTVTLPCLSGSDSSLSYLRGMDKMAHHTCDSMGNWEDLNTSLCPFTSANTRALLHFSTTNITEKGSSLYRSVKGLHQFTQPDILKSHEDLVFLTRTLEYYSQELHKVNFIEEDFSSMSSRLSDNPRMSGDHMDEKQKQELALMMLDLIGISSSASQSNLTAAEFEDKSCSRMLAILFGLLDDMPSLVQTSPPSLYTLQQPIITKQTPKLDLLMSSESSSQLPLEFTKKTSGEAKKTVEKRSTEVKADEEFQNDTSTVNPNEENDDIDSDMVEESVTVNSDLNITADNEVTDLNSTVNSTIDNEDVHTLPSNNESHKSSLDSLRKMFEERRKKTSFSGLECALFRRSLHTSQRLFHCNGPGENNLRTEKSVVDILLDIPPTAFDFLHLTKEKLNDTNSTSLDYLLRHRLQVVAYDTPHLFTIRDGGNWRVTSRVIGVRIHGTPLNESQTIDSKVTVTMTSSLYSHNVIPVWYNFSDGNWSSEGCDVTRMSNSKVTFSCSVLGHYGILQDISPLYTGEGMVPLGASFRYSAPAVYIGSAICVIFLMLTILTWSLLHPVIHTMSKNKHSYVNTWLSMVMLICLYTVGVYQTENRGLCQGIGITLHYLSSCVLLWLIVSVTNLYKKITKSIRPPMLSDEPPPDSLLPPKPMLRFYLVGYGVSLILCGISVALNFPQYASYHYCFLSWGPSLGAFYTPSIVLIVIMMVFCLLTHCVLKSSSPGSYSEAPANTETTELELLDATSPNSENAPVTTGASASGNTARYTNADRVSLSNVSDNVFDCHHSPITQLRAHEVTLILFVLTWTAAAITTSSPFDAVIPYHTTLFSILYALCATSLGVFVFIFFCFSRSDIKEFLYSNQLKERLCCIESKEKNSELVLQTVVTNNIGSSASGSSGVNLINNATTVSSNTALQSANNVPLSFANNSSVVNVDPSVHSSSRSPTNRSASVKNVRMTHSPVKHSDLIMKPHQPGTSLPLFAVGATNDNINCSPDIFYNPKQAGVARRFFQKQRLKQMIKQNNLGLNPVNDDSDCNSSVLYLPRPLRSNISGNEVSNFDPSFLGASSKVNNTNIHVDHNNVFNSHYKQTDKSPTPELLCVFGPNKQSPVTNVERQNKSFSRSPIDEPRTDDIPRIDATSAYQYNSDNSYQTPTHDGISRPYQKIQNDIINEPHMHSDIAMLGECVEASSPTLSRGKRGLHSRPEGATSREKGRGRHRRAKSRSSSTKDSADIESLDRNSPDCSENLNDAIVPSMRDTEKIYSYGNNFSPLVTSSEAPKGNSWNHASGMTPNRRVNVPWQENIQAAGNWDSETGEEASCCEGDSLPLKKTPNDGETINHRYSIASDTASIATSLLPATGDNSPPGSILMTSDSPFDSPLHNVHQNTPDYEEQLSINSSNLNYSPEKKPTETNIDSSFPYFRNLEAKGKRMAKTAPNESVNQLKSVKARASDKLSQSFSKKKNKINDKKLNKSFSDSPNSIHDSVSSGLQISNWFFKRNKSNKNENSRFPAAPQEVEDPNPLFRVDDPIVNVNFKFRDNDSDSESNNDMANCDPLVTTPRSECSSDSDYNINGNEICVQNYQAYEDELMSVLTNPLIPSPQTTPLTKDNSVSVATLTAASPSPLKHASISSTTSTPVRPSYTSEHSDILQPSPPKNVMQQPATNLATLQELIDSLDPLRLEGRESPKVDAVDQRPVEREDIKYQQIRMIDEDENAVTSNGGDERSLSDGETSNAQAGDQRSVEKEPESLDPLNSRETCV